MYLDQMVRCLESAFLHACCRIIHFLNVSLSCQQRQQQHRERLGKNSELAAQAAILDWVKSPILVTLYQQQRRDNRVRECLRGETPLQSSREAGGERINTADSLAEKPGWEENAGSSGHCWSIIKTVS